MKEFKKPSELDVEIPIAVMEEMESYQTDDGSPLPDVRLKYFFVRHFEAFCDLGSYFNDS